MASIVPKMIPIKRIIDELNIENGSKYKMQVLRKYSHYELLKRVLKMTYDKVTFTYGISMKHIIYKNIVIRYDLEHALDFLENKFVSRDSTGNQAINDLMYLLNCVSEEDAQIIVGIINRDQRINLGRTNINKVFKNLIVKPPYSRCDIGTKKNIEKNLDFEKGVYSQEKMDGTYRSALTDGDQCTIMSRPGIESSFPNIEKDLLALNVNGFTFIGEMTLKGEKDRKKGNGLIDSDHPPHEDIIYTIWDMIPNDEYIMKNGYSNYEDRLKKLEKLLQNNYKYLRLVPYKVIKSMREAYEHFSEITGEGGEGTVLKSFDLKWKDGTSKQQLKVKLEIFLEVRCTGFNEGGKGKRASTFKSMKFENDEGTIVGNCSGFEDDELEYINAHRDECIGKVFEIKCNDITLAKNKTAHALSHGNFQEFRKDKDTTDTLERALELKEMAKELS